MCVKDIKLPQYQLKDELWNSITHGLGAIFGIVALILMLVKINSTSNLEGIDRIFANISCSIYGFSLIVCMCISCIYHALKKNNGKRVLRVLDHDFVFFLVAGTYTPYCLIAMRDLPLWGISNSNFSGYIILILVYALCILGIVFNSINIDKYALLSMIIYIGAGWSIAINVVELIKAIPLNSIILLVLGGITYTIGAIIYGIGKKKPFMHSVFHIFILGGIVSQFFSIYLYLI